MSPELLRSIIEVAGLFIAAFVGLLRLIKAADAMVDKAIEAFEKAILAFDTLKQSETEHVKQINELVARVTGSDYRTEIVYEKQKVLDDRLKFVEEWIKMREPTK